MVRLTALAADSGLVTSATMGSTAVSPPNSRISLAVLSSHSSLMSSIATRAPAPTKAAVMARPIPMGLAAPVTMAILPCNGLSVVVTVGSPSDWARFFLNSGAIYTGGESDTPRTVFAPSRGGEHLAFVEWQGCQLHPQGQAVFAQPGRQGDSGQAR